MKRGAFCSALQGDLVLRSGPFEMICRLCSWGVFLNRFWAAVVVLPWVPAGSSYVSPGTTGNPAACRNSSLCCHGVSFPVFPLPSSAFIAFQIDQGFLRGPPGRAVLWISRQVFFRQ